jgi:hypothetical protein
MLVARPEFTYTHLGLCCVLPVSPAQGRCLSVGDENAAQDVLELLIEVAEGYPRFLRKHLQDMVSAMMQVGRRGGLEVCVFVGVGVC